MYNCVAMPYDRMDMDISADPTVIAIEESPVGVVFTTEACLQRQIAYVITTVAMTLLNKKEICYPNAEQGRIFPNCLPNRFIAEQMGTQFANRIYYDNQMGEYQGQILVIDREGTSWEKRKIYSFDKTPPRYFGLCFASKVVTKEYMFPSENLAHKIQELKGQVPIVDQIWAHFHILVKELSTEVFKNEDWDKTKQFVKTEKPKSLSINSGKLTFALNQVKLQEYVMGLAEQELNFIPCFQRVCREWEMFKRSWSNEDMETQKHDHRLKEILLKNE